MDVEQLNPVDLNLINDLWVPNVFIYNLKTFKVSICSMSLKLGLQKIQQTFHPAQMRLDTTVESRSMTFSHLQNEIARTTRCPELYCEWLVSGS